MQVETIRLVALLLVNGILFLMVLCRVIMLTQKVWSWRSAWFTALFASLFALFAGRSLGLPEPAILVIYGFLVTTLAVCTFHEWRDFFSWLRRDKEATNG